MILEVIKNIGNKKVYKIEDLDQDGVQKRRYCVDSELIWSIFSNLPKFKDFKYSLRINTAKQQPTTTINMAVVMIKEITIFDLYFQPG